MEIQKEVLDEADQPQELSLGRNLASQVENSNSSRPTSPDDVYSCDYCIKKFCSAQALGGHQNAHKKERAKKFESTMNTVMAVPLNTTLMRSIDILAHSLVHQPSRYGPPVSTSLSEGSTSCTERSPITLGATMDMMQPGSCYLDQQPQKLLEQPFDKQLDLTLKLPYDSQLDLTLKLPSDTELDLTLKL